VKDIGLTPIEAKILKRSSDLAVTRRRRTTCVLSGIVTAVVCAGVAWKTQSWQLVLILTLIYMAGVGVERFAYAAAVLAYKSLVQKLKARIEELEAESERR
jgi:hypothetical protein